MRIGFYAGKCIPVHAFSLEQRPLGGTETALIRVSEILAARGHDVTVFTALKDAPASNPRYIFHGRLFDEGRFDAAIFVQDWRTMFFGRAGEREYFWTGDGFDQYANFGLGDRRVVNRLSKFLAVSRWQAETLCERSGFPVEKTTIVGNGAHLPYFSGEETRMRKRLIFASAPYRGLQLIPSIFPELKKRHPDLELHVFAGMNLYDTDKPFSGPEAAFSKKICDLIKDVPGITLHGNVTQRQLAREMMKSAILVYPNVIFETCCIVALEAQAAGCPVIASATSALPETVADCGVLVDGEPGSEPYIHEFIAATDRLLTDDAAWSELSAKALARSRADFSWERVADRFESAIGTS